MNEHPDVTRLVYVTMAAVSGAVTALSFMPWKTMRVTEIVMTLVVGSAFAAFGVPYLVGEVAGVDLNNLRAACFFTYMGATGANMFLPVIIRRLKERLDTLLPGKGEGA